MKVSRSRLSAYQALLAIAVAMSLFPGAPALAQMSGGMREMMQRMMGDVLPPGVDPNLLPEPESRGARLLERYCTQCHNLPGPGIHTATEWPLVVNRMNGRMQMMSGGGMMGGGMMGVSVPSAPELNALNEYLLKHAQKPIDLAKYPDLDSPAGRIFQGACAQCHALPDPQQHTSPEWPTVVTRMRKNMSTMGKPVPDEPTTKTIIEFLQRHALNRN
jgi:cytochrome c5